MSVQVTVHTDDVSPTQAPYKVSARPGHTDALVTIDVTGDGPVRAYRMLRDSSAIVQGAELAMIGGVCGISRCGTFKPTAIPTPARFVEPIAASELGAEGAHRIGLYVYNGGVFE